MRPKKAPVKLMFIRADDSWPKSLNGFWGNVLCRYYLGVNQDCSKILILMIVKNFDSK